MSPHDFKAGDRVRCINALWTSLMEGDEYRVASADPRYVIVEGDTGRWSADRFQPVEAPPAPMPSAFTLVVVESPYAGDVATNLRYLRAAMADCLARGEAPFASHALYTQAGVLDDTKPEERRKGMEAGFAWGDCAQRCVVYTDLGLTSGMLKGLERALARKQSVEFRTLKGWAP